eukprot:87059_1
MRRKKKNSAIGSAVWHKNVPLLYDTIHHKQLLCPSYSCTFGDLISENRHCNKYRVFQSRATNANYLKDKHIWQGLPHALIICDIDIPHPQRTNLNEQWHKTDNNIHYEETKRIIHPGPILRIKQMRDLPQIVATHTQHKYVFLWNTLTQHDRDMVNNSDPNTPELILKGHKKDAVYALDFSHKDHGVASGSKDERICVWNIGDYQSVLSAQSEPDKKEFVPLSKPSPKLKPRHILKGHSGEVTDVEFAPYSPFIIGSVSLDSSLKIWDLRRAHAQQSELDNTSAQTVHNLHASEITNLSWNALNHDHIVTAGSDGSIKLLDVRKIAANNACVIKEFKGHQKRISSLEWNPSVDATNANYFLSGSHDGSVVIWNTNGMVFKHIGHNSQVIHSASWIRNNGYDSWCVASTSSPKAFVPFFWSSSSDKTMIASTDEKANGNCDYEDANPNDISDGGIMQIWRPSMLLKMDKNDIVQYLKQKKNK